jgi:hypothetical protein
MNTKPKRLRRKQERHYSAHNTFIRIARLELDKAKPKAPGWFNSAFITITFSALAIEALCNAVGDRIIPNWNNYERESPLKKVELLANHLNLGFSLNKEPWRTINWLSKLRNDLAHPKPERVVTDKIIVANEKNIDRVDAPDSKLEKEITVGKAGSAYRAVEELKIAFCENIPPEDSFGLFSDGWATSTEIHHEA